MEIELILMRQLASYLTLPIFLIGVDGQLLYYNEAAAEHLGRPFEEAGEILLKDLSTIFDVRKPDGSDYPPGDFPLTVALQEHRPKHDTIRYHAFDGVDHEVQVTAFPLEGHGGRHIGAVAMFWEHRP